MSPARRRDLGILRVPGDVGAPLGQLLRGARARLLRLVQQRRGALHVAVRECLGDLGRIQALLEARHARILGRRGLEVRQRLRGLIEARAAQGLIEAPGQHRGHALQAIARLGIAAIGGGGRTIIKKCIVPAGLGEAPLVHGEARLLQQLIDLALHDGGVGDRRGRSLRSRRAARWRRGRCRCARGG